MSTPPTSTRSTPRTQSTPDPARRTRLLPRRSALRSLSALAALASTGALTGCGSTPDKDRDDALAKIEWLPSEVDTESVSLDQQRATTAVTACNAVGATMLSTLLRQATGSNALSCPVGITFILALLYAGAESVGEGVNVALGVRPTPRPSPATPPGAPSGRPSSASTSPTSSSCETSTPGPSRNHR